jgi:hypothetical protein
MEHRGIIQEIQRGYSRLERFALSAEIDFRLAHCGGTVPLFSALPAPAESRFAEHRAWANNESSTSRRLGSTHSRHVNCKSAR